ncbi:unnamed protein product [marine sediment metagenome]|uniref:Uncharacterized protein n=1 Tax=marine sediment metagenome TaxID=412755 RepID=X0YVB2_9ZZZZ
MTLIIESVINTIPSKTINTPEMIETRLRCLLSLFRNFEKKLIKMLASIKGIPSPSEKTPRSSIPPARVSSLLARSSIPESIRPTHGIQPKENIMPKIKEPANPDLIEPGILNLFSKFKNFILKRPI